MRSPHETHGITPISHQIHVSYHNHHIYLKHSILMQVLNQPTKIQPTYQFQSIGIKQSCIFTYFRF